MGGQGKPGVSRVKNVNKLNSHLILSIGSCTHTTMVGRECYHQCTIPAPIQHYTERIRVLVGRMTDLNNNKDKLG